MNRSSHGPLAVLLSAIATLILVIGGLVFVINLVSVNADRGALRDPVRVVAEVTHIDVQEPGLNRDRETLVTPTVTFATEDGQEVTAELAPGRGALSYGVGDLVSVAYERTDPSVAVDEGDTSNGYVQMFFSALAMVGALALYVVAIVFSLVALRNRLTL